MLRVYAAWKTRCWGVQPDDMCRNCSYIFFDNFPFGVVPSLWSPLEHDMMERSHKYLHDQLRCDLERVGVVGGAEADDKELSGIDQMVGTVEQLAPWSGSARLWRARQCQRLRMVCVRVRFNTGFTTLGPKARLARIARSMLSLALRSYIVYALL